MKLVQASIYLGLLMLISFASIAECQDGIVLTPPNSQTVAINSPDNITYSCSITENRAAQWSFTGIQLTENSPTLITLLNQGLVIEPGATLSQSTIIFTSQVRSFLNNLPNNNNIIPVSCNALSQSDVNIDFGDTVFIRTFFAPTEVVGLDFNPISEDLTRLELSWQPPENTLDEPADPVVTTYTITVSGPLFNFVNTTTELSYVIIDDPNMMCSDHVFSVMASNDAGDGPASTIEETIPISPGITALETSLTVDRIELSSTVITALVTFDAAINCSLNFPIISYNVTVSMGDQSSVLSILPSQFVGLSSISSPVPNDLLVLDSEYQVVVSACISVTCRSSTPRTLRTTDTQSASIRFFESNVFLQCSFARSIVGSGCGFRLTLANGDTEMLRLSAEGGMPCGQTQNMENAYTSIEVFDMEADGSFGTVAVPLTVLTQSASAEQYTSETGCVPSGPLSVGAIVGIVIGVLAAVLIILAIAIVIAVVVYNQRTKKLPKMRSTDDEKVYVDFEKHWLMDDSMAVKRSGSLKKSRVGLKRGGSAVDGDEIILSPADALSPAAKGASPPAQGAATMPLISQGTPLTSPPAAFTLHISKDHKRARLHLDKALIRRVLKEQKMSMTTLERKAARSRTTGNLQARELLLPLHSEIHVTGEEDEDQDRDPSPVTNL